MARQTLRYAIPLASVLQIFPASAQQTLTPQQRFDGDVAKVEAYRTLLNGGVATAESRTNCVTGLADLQQLLTDIKGVKWQKDPGLVDLREFHLRPKIRNIQNSGGCPDVPPPPGWVGRKLNWIWQHLP